MLVFIGAMMGLVLAGNLVQFYLLWEVLGICSALLIAFWWDREPARKAGLKAFLVTRVGDIALLIAVVMIFADLHTVEIPSVLASVSTSQGGVSWSLVGVLLLIGAMGKSAQVPFHVWLPDAMEGPTPVSALIHAATMVNAGVYLLARMAPVFAASPALSDSVLAVGLVSLVVGGVCASAATDIKRALAYSTISQLGLMFAAIGVGSAAAAIYQLIGQGVFKALGFMSAGSVSEATGTRDIQRMGGLAGKMRFTYVGFLASALAMAGFPPFFGFWTKEYIASFALSAGTWVFLVLLAGSALTTFYMFRVLFRVFHGKEANPGAKESGGLMVGPMVLLSLVSAAGWLAVAYQSLYSPALGTGLDPYTSVSSAVVVFGVLYAGYLAFGKPHLVDSVMKEGGFLWRTAAVLREGIWFDAAYSYLVRSVFYPAAGAAQRIQTGDLGKNVSLLLAALVAAILVVLLVVA
jgi:NADH-quinone oxidoreductase subunit L